MNNPFQELFPEEPSPQEEVEAEVMGSIHLKSFFADIAEFFMAIFGVTVTTSLAQSQAPDLSQIPPKSHDPDQPDFLY